MPGEQLEVYLRDHYAGSAGGASLARHLVETASGTDRKALAGVADGIDEDREALGAIMERLEVEPSRVKQGGAWLGEKVGRVKLRASSPAGRVLQFESLIMGVTGKLELWRSLRELADADRRLEKRDLQKLISRAEAQRRTLEQLHGKAAARLA